MTKLQALALGMSRTLPDKLLLYSILVISRYDLHAAQRHRSKIANGGHGLALDGTDDLTRSILVQQSWGFSNPYDHADVPILGNLCPTKLDFVICNEDSTLHLWLSYILGPHYASQESTFEHCISIIVIIDLEGGKVSGLLWHCMS